MRGEKKVQIAIKIAKTELQPKKTNNQIMNMKTKFGWLLIYVDYDSGECFMKRNEVWFMCTKKKKKTQRKKPNEWQQY